MDKSTLVEPRIENARKLLGLLKAAGFEVTAAFWLKEEGYWKFFIASPEVDRDWGGGYAKFHAVFVKAAESDEIDWLRLSDISLRSSQDPMVKDVLEVWRRYPKYIARHYSGSRLGDHTIEGAYLYEPAVAPA